MDLFSKQTNRQKFSKPSPENLGHASLGKGRSNLDHMGHMNVQYYVHLFDQATWVLFDRVGLSASYFVETGTGMAALEQRLTYKREVFAGTVVTIDSQVLDVTEKTVRFLHTMRG